MSNQLDTVNLPVMDGIESSDDSTTVAGSPNGLTITQKPFKTVIAEQPVTEERKPFLPPPASVLQNAGTARATLAASHEKPNGTTDNNYAGTHQNQTVVQQHVEYWDTDHDGIIWPQDTYIGCRKWGWSPPLAALVAFIINFNLSYPTLPGFLPDPFFRIYVDKVYKDKHGSDSMTYDNEGRFKPQNFEDIFSKYDKGDKGGLDIWDFLRFWKGQRMVFDFFGWSATMLEWLATYLLLWPEDGIMRKEDIRGVYDGSIFYKKAEEYQRKKKMRQEQRKGTSPRLVSMAQKVL